MGRISMSPEICLGSVFLTLTIGAIAGAIFSRRPDARMNFFLSFLERNLSDQDRPHRLDEPTPLRPKQDT